MKILAKILASRMQTVLSQLIGLDQTRFIPCRETRDNTNKLINIMHYAKHKKIPFMLLSTDAEKAFDRVNWTYMFSCLEKFGFGERLCQWIKSLYSGPIAKIRVNRILYDYITI